MTVSFQSDTVMSYMLSAICYRPSVCLSVTRVDQSKTVKVKMKLSSPQSSPIHLMQYKFKPEIL